MKRLLLAGVLLLTLAGRLVAQNAPEQELWIANGERRIYGVLSRPTAGTPLRGVAIVAHGFNGSHAFGRNYFRTLNELGYACYTFDFPGGSLRSRSGNNTMQMSVLDQQADLEAVVRHFRAQPDAKQIVLIGESQGGLVAALAAAHRPESVDRLILLYPALCIPRDWRKHYPDLTQVPDTTRLWNVPLSRRYFEEVHDMDPFELVRAYAGPVLMLQGDADPIVPLADSERAAAGYADARLRVLPGAGHGFSGTDLQQALEAIEAFLSPLEARFAEPPQEARPLMIWEWMDGVVTAEGITADLEAYRKAGIGGVQQFVVGGALQTLVRDTTNAVGTDAWRRLMQHAIAECERLGLSFGTHNCPGWSSSAFPTVRPEDSMQKLVWSETAATGSKRLRITLPQPEVDPQWNYYREVAVLAVPDAEQVDPARIVDLTAAMRPDGRIDIRLPHGRWRIFRFGHTTNGKTNAATGPTGGVGLECDKMSREAVRRYWAGYPQLLLELAGDAAGGTFSRLEIDSYEAGGQDWTPQMPDAFARRQGYDLRRWLPVLAGVTVGDAERSKQFNDHFEATVRALFAENYYGYMAELAHDAGLKLLYQPYGTGAAKPFNPIDTERIARQLPDDLFCTEFWTHPDSWGWPSVPRHMAVAHRLGIQRIYAEGFTCWPLSAWQDDPQSLKPQADRAFALGVNALMLHAAAQNPWPDVVPGMTFGKWGTQFTPGQTWWKPAARPFFDYLARCQALLQAGRWVDDFNTENPSLRSDFEAIRWTHRRTGEGDLWFVANPADSLVDVTLCFAAEGRLPELWHPDTGERTEASAWERTDDELRIALRLEPWQSLFVVLRRPADTDGPGLRQHDPQPVGLHPVAGTWQVNFPAGWGAPERIELPELIPWNEHPDAGVRYFSGTARYAQTVALDAAPAPGERWELDLGDVKNIAAVRINGRDCALLWKKPFRCDVTAALQAGENRLEIEVTNLWPNRLIGDEQEPDDIVWEEPEHYAYAPGNPSVGSLMREIPDWLRNGTPRPSAGRKTVVSFKFFDREAPLHPAGLLGPVLLRVCPTPALRE